MQETITDFLHLEFEKKQGETNTERRERWQSEVSQGRHEVDLVALVLNFLPSIMMQVEVKSGASQDNAVEQMKHFRRHLMRVYGEHLKDWRYQPVIAMPYMKGAEERCECNELPIPGITKVGYEYQCCPKPLTKPKHNCDFFRWKSKPKFEVTASKKVELGSNCHCGLKTERQFLPLRNKKKGNSKNKQTDRLIRCFNYCLNLKCNFFEWSSSRESEIEETDMQPTEKMSQKHLNGGSGKDKGNTRRMTKEQGSCCARFYLNQEDLNTQNVISKFMLNSTCRHDEMEEDDKLSRQKLFKHLLIISTMVFTSMSTSLSLSEHGRAGHGPKINVIFLR